MNRRGFLKSLLGAAAGAALAPTLGRVYSFPTNIRLANLAEVEYLYDETGQLNEWEPTKNVTYTFGTYAVFVANLNALDHPLYSLDDTVVTARTPSTSVIHFWEPSTADPEHIIRATEIETHGGDLAYHTSVTFTEKTHRTSYRRLCQPAILPAINT